MHGLPFDQPSVRTLAPPRSGVYMLRSGPTVLYVGRALNLREQLGEHLDERDNAALADAMRERPCTFGFVEAPPARLASMELYYVRLLEPSCNRRLAG